MNKKIIISFIGVVCISMLLLWLISIGLNTSLVNLAPLYMLSPLVATIAINKRFKLEVFQFPKRIKINRWFFLAWLLPLVVIHLSLALSLLFPSTHFSQLDNSTGLNKLMINAVIGYAIVLFAGLTVNALFAFAEEILWRGLLYNQFRNKGFWKSSFIIGFIWGVWHIPLILSGYNYPNYPILGSLFFIILCVLMSPLYTLLRDKGKSVLLASIFHGTFNASIGISINTFEGGNEMVTSGVGLTGLIVFIIINLIIYSYLGKKELEFIEGKREF